MPARPVPAVVAQGDRLGQGHVEPARPGDRSGHLRHLECVGEARPLMVLWEDEHLGLAGQAAERGGVEDPVPVPLETGAPRVRLLDLGPLSATDGARGARSEEPLLALLAGLPFEGAPGGPRTRRRRHCRCHRCRLPPGGRSGRSSRHGPGGPGPNTPTSSKPNGRCGPISRAVGTWLMSCSLPYGCNVQVPAGPARGVERSQIRWTCASESSRPPKSWKWS